ncbi:MAG: phenylacetate--CoA ligase [Spirochaetales bacterium]|nr:phenylacetate--CoA ligase [Spirochaetales bacterium]
MKHNCSFRDKKIETMSREELESLQIIKLREIVASALKTDFYKERLNSIGLSDAKDIKGFEDFRKIPFTTKDDLRNAFPYGMLSVDKKDVVRMHASSGTTGTPTVIYFSQDDLDAWTEIVARSVVCTGCSNSDVFQNMMTYGLFTGGLGVHYGAEKSGMMVIPTSSGNTMRQLKLMKDFQTTVVHATPSYLLHMFHQVEAEGFSLSDFNLKKALIGAEPHSEDTRKKIEALYGIDAYNSYGLSEMNGPGVAFECEYKDGMHVWEDGYIAEIVDRYTLNPIDEGEGELVLTNLIRHATPILRYRTRDLTEFVSGDCACGRTHRRIKRIKGRTDDMLIINGVNVFPSQIEEIIMKLPEIGNNYLIEVSKQGDLDKLTVKTEVNNQIFTDDTRDLNKLKGKIKETLKATIFINPEVSLHETGSLPVTQGKAVRVIDHRDSN